MRNAKIELGAWVEDLVDFATTHFEGLFNAASRLADTLLDVGIDVLSLPPLLVGAAVVAASWVAGGLRLVLFCAFSLVLIHNLGLWDKTVETVAFMSVAVAASLVVGIPLGMLTGESARARKVADPILDFLQTLHPFVYFVPAVVAFGIGAAPGILATLVYVTPIPLRLTALGIRNLPSEVVEAGAAFGGSRTQILLKIKVPLATPAILAGMNQCVLITLTFSVFASLIGAGGLGEDIVRGINSVDLALGVEAGIAVVLVAMMLDKLTGGFARLALRRYGVTE